MKVKYIGIYASVSRGEDFLLYTEGGEKKELIDKVSSQSKLVLYLEEKQDILVYDEILRHSQGGKDSALDGILNEMKSLRAPVILPSLLSNHLVSFLIRGEVMSFYMWDVRRPTCNHLCEAVLENKRRKDKYGWNTV